MDEHEKDDSQNDSGDDGEERGEREEAFDPEQIEDDPAYNPSGGLKDIKGG